MGLHCLCIFTGFLCLGMSLTAQTQVPDAVSESPKCLPNEYGENCTYCVQKDSCSDGHYTCDFSTGDKRCFPGWNGDSCRTKIDSDMTFVSCPDNQCRNGGSCVSGSCCCVEGFTGVLCEIEIIECTNTSCQNGGICKDLIGRYECLCRDGYTGNQCEISPSTGTTTPSRDTNCRANTCRNNGTCFEDRFFTYCMCPTWYTGDACEISLKPEQAGTSSHTCPANYYGRSCEVYCVETDSCTDGHYVCNQVTGAKVCMSGWLGDRCDTRMLPQSLDPYCPSGLACKNDGQCNRGTCCCRNNYSGQLCQRESIGCLSSPCNNNGTCNDTVGGGGFTCTCEANYSGEYCEIEVHPYIEGTVAPPDLNFPPSVVSSYINMSTYSTSVALEVTPPTSSISSSPDFSINTVMPSTTETVSRSILSETVSGGLHTDYLNRENLTMSITYTTSTDLTPSSETVDTSHQLFSSSIANTDIVITTYFPDSIDTSVQSERLSIREIINNTATLDQTDASSYFAIISTQSVISTRFEIPSSQSTNQMPTHLTETVSAVNSTYNHWSSSFAANNTHDTSLIMPSAFREMSQTDNTAFTKEIESGFPSFHSTDTVDGSVVSLGNTVEEIMQTSSLEYLTSSSSIVQSSSTHTTPLAMKSSRDVTTEQMGISSVSGGLSPTVITSSELSYPTLSYSGEPSSTTLTPNTAALYSIADIYVSSQTSASSIGLIIDSSSSSLANVVSSHASQTYTDTSTQLYTSTNIFPIPSTFDTVSFTSKISHTSSSSKSPSPIAYTSSLQNVIPLTSRPSEITDQSPSSYLEGSFRSVESSFFDKIDTSSSAFDGYSKEVTKPAEKQSDYNTAVSTNTERSSLSGSRISSSIYLMSSTYQIDSSVKSSKRVVHPTINTYMDNSKTMLVHPLSIMGFSKATVSPSILPSTSGSAIDPLVTSSTKPGSAGTPAPFLSSSSRPDSNPSNSNTSDDVPVVWWVILIIVLVAVLIAVSVVIIAIAIIRKRRSDFRSLVQSPEAIVAFDKEHFSFQPEISNPTYEPDDDSDDDSVKHDIYVVNK